jgi:hypothetical protein
MTWLKEIDIGMKANRIRAFIFLWLCVKWIRKKYGIGLKGIKKAWKVSGILY